jgi:hypothetical protein
MSEEKKVGLTAADLKDILATVVQEARKPIVTEQQEREIAQRQEERKQSVEQIEEERRNDEWQKKVCTHRHSMKNGGAPRVVQNNFDAKSGGTFMVCLRCQKVIRPEVEPALYNSLFEENSVVNY